MKSVSCWLVGALSFAFAASAGASGILFANLKVDFTVPADAAAKALWSEPDRINVSAGGLGWNGEAASSTDGWIRTRPVAIGLRWRPASYVSVRVHVAHDSREIVLNDGSRYTPHFGTVFVRYSPDLEHWSSWLTLQRVEGKGHDGQPLPPGSHFKLNIQIPRAAREGYSQQLAAYAELDVPWKSDEDAAVRWIVKREPDFFARNIPFAGYVEFLVETGFHGGQRIRALEVDVICSIGGTAAVPRDKNIYTRTTGPWAYRAESRADVALFPTDPAPAPATPR